MKVTAITSPPAPRTETAMLEPWTERTFGKRVVGGLRVHSAPPCDSVWFNTYNLRWWEHVHNVRANDSPPVGDAVRDTG